MVVVHFAQSGVLPFIQSLRNVVHIGVSFSSVLINNVHI